MQTTIDDVISTLQSKWGRGTIQRGARSASHQAHLSTGSHELDTLLEGGWRIGKGQALTGYGSSGATTLAYRTLAAA
ncbi:MAG: hypothetical protein KDD73_15385 [Anaerolineales bacterium]|nr:hypothetical protein [Anaerolineales bacterium]